MSILFGHKRGVVFLLFLLLLLAFFIKNVNAIVVEDPTSENNAFFNVSVGSPDNYTLYINLTNNLGGPDYNVTFFLPYGMINNSDSSCNGALGFRTLNLTNNACTVNVTLTAGQELTLNVNITANISAFTRFLDTAEYIYVNVSNATDSATATLNPSGIYGFNYWINPRPYAKNSSDNNATLKFIYWGQARQKYETWVPLYTYNVTSNKTQLANLTYSEILYANTPFYNFPDYMELMAYRLNFTIYFNLTGNEGGETASFQINTVNYNKACQVLIPLQSITNSFTDPLANTSYNQTIAIPGGNSGLFDIDFYNNTAYEKHTTGSLTANYSINITYNVAEANANVILNVTTPTRNDNFSLSIMYGLISSSDQNTCSPLYIESQSIEGFDPDSNPPELGEQINNSYQIKVNNSLPNFTLSNLLVHFVQPLNASMNLSRTGNTSFFNLTTDLFVGWLNTSNTWDNQSEPFNYYLECTNFNDTITDSPTNGSKFTVCFYVADINLSMPHFNNWNPGQADSNATINLTSSLQFPILNEESGVSGGAGSANSYNVSVSMSSESTLTIPTSKLTDLTSGNCPTASTCNLNITVDGNEITELNYTIGSITLNSKLSASTHSVSVGYSIPSTTTSTTTGGTTTTTSSGELPPTPKKEEGFDIDFSVEDKEEVNIRGYQNREISLSFDGVTEHKVTISKVDATNQEVTLTITSDPIEVTIKVGETKEVDVNRDRINDLEITLNSITAGLADLTFKKIVIEPTEEVMEDVVEEEGVEEKEEVSKIWYIILIIIVVLIIVYFVLNKKKKH